MTTDYIPPDGPVQVPGKIGRGPDAAPRCPDCNKLTDEPHHELCEEMPVAKPTAVPDIARMETPYDDEVAQLPNQWTGHKFRGLQQGYKEGWYARDAEVARLQQELDGTNMLFDVQTSNVTAIAEERDAALERVRGLVEWLENCENHDYCGYELDHGIAVSTVLEKITEEPNDE